VGHYALDEAVAKAAREVDVVLERINDESFLRMIASGLDEETALDLIDQIREANTGARESTLADIRALLVKEFPQ
jgi:hypothetical protein